MVREQQPKPNRKLVRDLEQKRLLAGADRQQRHRFARVRTAGLQAVGARRGQWQPQPRPRARWKRDDPAKTAPPPLRDLCCRLALTVRSRFQATPRTLCLTMIESACSVWCVAGPCPRATSGVSGVRAVPPSLQASAPPPRQGSRASSERAHLLHRLGVRARHDHANCLRFGGVLYPTAGNVGDLQHRQETRATRHQPQPRELRLGRKLPDARPASIEVSGAASYPT